MPLAGLLVELDESVVFHQRYRDFCLIYIDNQVFYGLHQKFSVKELVGCAPSGLFKTKEADPQVSLSLADC
jgi:hypothetical protein